MHKSLERLMEVWKDTWRARLIEYYCAVVDDLPKPDNFSVSSKEKYWRLRIDSFSSTNAIMEMDEMVEHLSCYVCDICWEEWYTRTDLWRWRTLCDKHYEEVKPKKKESDHVWYLQQQWVI